MIPEPSVADWWIPFIVALILPFRTRLQQLLSQFRKHNRRLLEQQKRIKRAIIDYNDAPTPQNFAILMNCHTHMDTLMRRRDFDEERLLADTLERLNWLMGGFISDRPWPAPRWHRGSPAHVLLPPRR